MSEEDRAFWLGIMIDLTFMEQIVSMIRRKTSDDVRKRIGDRIGTNSTF